MTNTASGQDSRIEALCRQIEAEYINGQCHFHKDWRIQSQRWGEALDRLFQSLKPRSREQIRVHDVTCGSGLQAFGLWDLGYQVSASDNSVFALERMVSQPFYDKQMRVFFHDLATDFPQQLNGSKDFVISVNNGWALFGLSVFAGIEDLAQVLRRIATLLNEQGCFFLALRTSSQLSEEKLLSTWTWADGADQLVVKNSAQPGEQENELLSQTTYQIVRDDKIRKEVHKQSSLRLWQDQEILAAADLAGLRCPHYSVHADPDNSYEETWFQFRK